MRKVRKDAEPVTIVQMDSRKQVQREQTLVTKKVR